MTFCRKKIKRTEEKEKKNDEMKQCLDSLEKEISLLKSRPTTMNNTLEKTILEYLA